MNYKRERRWINKKVKSGVKRSELRESVGAFSNKKKKKVMAEKRLSSSGYEKRRKFLANVYYVLCNEPDKPAKKVTTRSSVVNKPKRKYKESSYDYFYGTEYTTQAQSYLEEPW